MRLDKSEHILPPTPKAHEPSSAPQPLKKEADITVSPPKAEAVAEKTKSAPIHQTMIMEKLDDFLQHFIDDKNEKESLPKEFKNGVCHGFSLMMMRADMVGERKKHLQRLHSVAEAKSEKLQKAAVLLNSYKNHFRALVQAEKKSHLEKYKDEKKLNLDYNLIRQRAIQEMKLNAEQKQLFDFGEDVYFFAHNLVATHNLKVSCELKINADGAPRKILQKDIIQILSLTAPDQLISLEKKTDLPFQVGFTINFPLRVPEIIRLVNDTILNGDLICFESPKHTIYVTKNSNKYMLYDPEFENDPIEFNSTEELINGPQGIKRFLFEEFGVDDDLLPITCNVIERKRPGEKSAPRPSYSQLIHGIFERRRQEKDEKVKAPDINTKTYDDNTGLIYATKNDNLPVVSELISHGADVNEEGGDGWFPLTSAASRGLLSIVTILLTAPRINVNIASEDGMTALHWACAEGYPEVALALILNGADINKLNTSDATPLEIAALEEHESCVKILIENGAEFKSILASYPEIIIKALSKIENAENVHTESLQEVMTHYQHLLMPLLTADVAPTTPAKIEAKNKLF